MPLTMKIAPAVLATVCIFAIGCQSTDSPSITFNKLLCDPKYGPVSFHERMQIHDLEFKPSNPKTLIDSSDKGTITWQAKDNGILFGNIYASVKSCTFADPLPIVFGGKRTSRELSSLSIDISENSKTLTVPASLLRHFRDPILATIRGGISRLSGKSDWDFMFVSIDGGSGERGYTVTFIFYPDRFAFPVLPRDFSDIHYCSRGSLFHERL